MEENTGDNSTSNDESQIKKMRAIGLTDAQIEAALGVKIQTTIDITPQQKVEVQKKDSSMITETNTIQNKQQYQGVSADILN